MLKSTLAAGLAAITLLTGLPPSMAADHGDAPFASVKRSGDLNDLYVFLDPNDNSRVAVILTLVGFTVPSEAVNFSVFDRELVFEFEFDTTFNARPDRRIQVGFSRKRTSGATPQTATIILCRDQCSESPPIGRRFTAPTTSSNLGDTAPTPTITTGPRGIQFFAGSADDPFFFDIPGFNRFVASVLAGAANPALLQRGRDSFAGYNTLVIGFSFPVSFFGPLRNNVLGAAARVFNPSVTRVSRQQIDRVATPGVNVGFVPLDLDDVQNRSSIVENTRGRIPAAIVATLRALGTNDAGIATLADLVVTRGDYVRVNTTIPNTGPGGGNNAGAGFPNGRRPVDDVIDTTLAIVTNGNPAASSDNADDDTGNLRRNVFPFLAPPIQPFPPTNPVGTPDSSVDDSTQN
ncbi:MAG: DUF4331 family protein [Actinomycetota bacterium]